MTQFLLFATPSLVPSLPHRKRVFRLMAIFNFIFVIINKAAIEMDYFGLYYPFMNSQINPFGYAVPSYPIQPFPPNSETVKVQESPKIKVEESSMPKEPKAPKIMARIKKLIRELHHQGSCNRKTHWTAEEDELLKKLIQVDKLDWKQMPQHFHSRSQNMCYSRYRRIQLSCKQKKWTQLQEDQLVKLVTQYGEKWKHISELFPKYTPKQIRERYLNYLRPNIDKADFSVDEDFKICRYVLENGKHWRKLEEMLPGRPEGSIKGRYYAKLAEIIERAHDDDD